MSALCSGLSELSQHNLFIDQAAKSYIEYTHLLVEFIMVIETHGPNLLNRWSLR